MSHHDKDHSLFHNGLPLSFTPSRVLLNQEPSKDNNSEDDFSDLEHTVQDQLDHFLEKVRTRHHKKEKRLNILKEKLSEHQKVLLQHEILYQDRLKRLQAVEKMVLLDSQEMQTPRQTYVETEMPRQDENMYIPTNSALKVQTNKRNLGSKETLESGYLSEYAASSLGSLSPQQQQPGFKWASASDNKQQENEIEPSFSRDMQLRNQVKRHGHIPKHHKKENDYAYSYSNNSLFSSFESLDDKSYKNPTTSRQDKLGKDQQYISKSAENILSPSRDNVGMSKRGELNADKITLNYSDYLLRKPAATDQVGVNACDGHQMPLHNTSNEKNQNIQEPTNRGNDMDNHDTSQIAPRTSSRSKDPADKPRVKPKPKLSRRNTSDTKGRNQTSDSIHIEDTYQVPSSSLTKKKVFESPQGSWLDVTSTDHLTGQSKAVPFYTKAPSMERFAIDPEDDIDIPQLHKVRAVRAVVNNQQRVLPVIEKRKLDRSSLHEARQVLTSLNNRHMYSLRNNPTVANIPQTQLQRRSQSAGQVANMYPEKQLRSTVTHTASTVNLNQQQFPARQLNIPANIQRKKIVPLAPMPESVQQKVQHHGQAYNKNRQTDFYDYARNEKLQNNKVPERNQHGPEYQTAFIQADKPVRISFRENQSNPVRITRNRRNLPDWT